MRFNKPLVQLEPEDIVAHHAQDLTVLSGEKPAENLSDFLYQLEIGRHRLEAAGHPNASHLDGAADCLAEASFKEAGEERVGLLMSAAMYLKPVTNWADAHR